MDIILTKDQRMEKLEKKFRELEHRMNKSFFRTDESFETFRKIIIHLQKENAELKSDKDFLMEKYKEVLRKLELQLPGNIVRPIKETINENVNLLKDIIVEDLDIEKDKKHSVDDLFELVMKNKKVSLKAAAKKLGSTEKKTLYWALKLQKQGLISVNNKFGSPELTRV